MQTTSVHPRFLILAFYTEKALFKLLQLLCISMWKMKSQMSKCPECPGLAEPGELGVARAGAHPRLRVQQGGSQVAANGEL